MICVKKGKHLPTIDHCAVEELPEMEYKDDRTDELEDAVAEEVGYG